MIKIKQKATFFLMLLHVVVFAQNFTISGKITNQLDGESLFGVNITTTDFKLGTTTNEYGFYTLTLPKETKTIVISYMGFNTLTKEITLDKNQTLNIELTEEANNLDIVTISTKEDTPPRVSLIRLANGSQLPAGKLMEKLPKCMSFATYGNSTSRNW